MVYYGEGQPRFEPLKTEEMPIIRGARIESQLPPEEQVSVSASYNLTDDGIQYAFENGDDLSNARDAIITHISQGREQGRGLSYAELYEYHKQHGFKAVTFNEVLQKLMREGLVYKTG